MWGIYALIYYIIGLGIAIGASVYREDTGRSISIGLFFAIQLFWAIILPAGLVGYLVYTVLKKLDDGKEGLD